MSLQVKYMDTPLGAQASAAVAANAGQPFSKPDQLATGVTGDPWATLEPEIWTLDGRKKLMADQPVQMGWWSKQPSDDQGVFAEPPVITVSFPKMYTASGLTFRFWPETDQWCSCVAVAWYRGNMLLAQATTQPTEAQWVFSYLVENFDKVEITLLQTNRPGQFAKLQQLQIGRVMVFMGDELVNVRLLNETDPSLCALAVDTMTVEIRDRTGRSLQPQKGQMVQLYRSGTPLATHYITDAQRQSRQNYRLRSQSVIGRLEDAFYGGIYRQYPIHNLLQAVLEGVPYGVDAAFQNETLTGYLPVCTKRQALQQIAFAIGAAVTTRGDGSIWLQTSTETISSGFTADRIFEGSKLKQEPPAGEVSLLVHSYIPGDEEKTLLKGTEITGEAVLLVFSEPYYNYQITGGALVDSDANWVKIRANGPVTLVAKKYRHTTTVYRKENPQTTEQGNGATVEKATLIHAGNAEAALQRLYRYYTTRDLLTQDVVVNGEMVGQLVESLSPWGSLVTGYIIGMESTFTDTGHTASIQIRGREVQA